MGGAPVPSAGASVTLRALAALLLSLPAAVGAQNCSATGAQTCFDCLSNNASFTWCSTPAVPASSSGAVIAEAAPSACYFGSNCACSAAQFGWAFQSATASAPSNASCVGGALQTGCAANTAAGCGGCIAASCVWVSPAAAAGIAPYCDSPQGGSNPPPSGWSVAAAAPSCPSPSPSPSAAASPSPTPSQSPSVARSPSVSASPVSPTTSPSVSPTSGLSVTPTTSLAATPSASPSPSPSVSATRPGNATSPLASPSPSQPPSPSVSRSPASVTPTNPPPGSQSPSAAGTPAPSNAPAHALTANASTAAQLKSAPAPLDACSICCVVAGYSLQAGGASSVAALLIPTAQSLPACEGVAPPATCRCNTLSGVYIGATVSGAAAIAGVVTTPGRALATVLGTPADFSVSASSTLGIRMALVQPAGDAGTASYALAGANCSSPDATPFCGDAVTLLPPPSPLPSTAAAAAAPSIAGPLIGGIAIGAVVVAAAAAVYAVMARRRARRAPLSRPPLNRADSVGAKVDVGNPLREGAKPQPPPPGPKPDALAAAAAAAPAPAPAPAVLSSPWPSRTPTAPVVAAAPSVAAADPSNEAPLPAGWSVHFSNSKQAPYYRNDVTGDVSWTRPDAEAEAAAVDATPLPEGWTERYSNSKQAPYYFNELTGDTSWVRPAWVPEATVSAFSETEVTEEAPLPEGYEQRWSNSKQANYYVNLASGETSWVRPA